MIESLIEVRLVGQPFWAILLPAIAIGVSLFSVGLTLWLRRRDDARLVVKTYESFVTDSYPVMRLIVIEATNSGRSGGTRLTALALKTKDGRTLDPPGFDRLDSRLPIRLEPGDGASVHFDLADVARVLVENNVRLRDVRPVARTGHGTYKGKLGKAVTRAMQANINKHSGAASTG